ncbi:hypothetical protein CRYUN_Cryun39dG0051100 [Craigia yunnanensis]
MQLLKRQHTCPTCRALVVPPKNGTSSSRGQHGPQSDAHQQGSNRSTSSIPLTSTGLNEILQLNLSSNSLSGPLPINIGKWKAVIDMDLSGDIRAGIGDFKGITHLSLSSNKLQGSIPPSTADMIDLEFLDLSRNNLSGTIPRSLEKLWNLKYFNVSFNILRGKIPDGGPFSNYSIQSFKGNQALCGAARLHLPPCKTNAHSPRSKKIRKLLEYVLPQVVATTILILALIIIFKRSSKTKASFLTHGDILPLPTWRRISYHELQQATDGFCESNLLGVGSFGSVYQGTFPDGMFIAVKVFNLEFKRAFKSFEVKCEMSLKEWVKQCLPSTVIQVMDTKLLSSRGRERLAAKDCALSILQLGGECSADLPEKKIDMKKVVVKLKKIKIKFLKDNERAR